MLRLFDFVWFFAALCLVWVKPVLGADLPRIRIHVKLVPEIKKIFLL